MKRTLMTMFMLLAGSLVLTAAPQQYQNQPQTGEESNPSAQNQMNREKVKITGCLEQGTEPDTYVLNNATPISGFNQGMNENQAENQQNQSMNPQEQQEENQANNQENNQQMPSAEARTQNSYFLVPQGNVDLKDHIGHKVEITGYLMAPGQMPRSQMQGQEQTPMKPEIRVSSVRHLAGTCQ